MDLFHGLQVAIMLALMTNILQFSWWKCKAKKVEGHWNKFGPCYLLIIATILVMIQPTSMLVIGSYQDDDTLIICNEDGTYTTEENFHGINNFFFAGDDTNSIVPNTTTGWMIQIFGTYLGFIFMFAGVVWSTNLHIKIKKKWSAIRGSQGNIGSVN